MRALVILLAGQAMASMDGSILVVTAPSLRADLHASGAQLQVVVAMYTLAFAALVVTGARLGDVMGRRLTTRVGLEHAGDLSGLVLAASLVGSVLGTTAVAGVYLAAAPHGAGYALATTTYVLAVVLAVTATSALRAVSASTAAG